MLFIYSLRLVFVSFCITSCSFANQQTAEDIDTIDKTNTQQEAKYILTPKTLLLNGSFDGRHNEALRSHNGEKANIWINSKGGLVIRALEGAELASQNEWHLFIYGYCMSACVQIFAPSFHDITLMSSPLIGFHASSALKNELFREATGASDSQCYLEVEDRLQKAHAANGLKLRYWKTIKKKLNIKPGSAATVRSESSNSADTKCSDIIYWAEYAFWFPTSAQLKDLGLDFKGTTAADEVDNIAKPLIDKAFDSGTKVLIGNEEYIVP